MFVLNFNTIELVTVLQMLHVWLGTADFIRIERTCRVHMRWPMPARKRCNENKCFFVCDLIRHVWVCMIERICSCAQHINLQVCFWLCVSISVVCVCGDSSWTGRWTRAVNKQNSIRSARRDHVGVRARTLYTLFQWLAAYVTLYFSCSMHFIQLFICNFNTWTLSHVCCTRVPRPEWR